MVSGFAETPRDNINFFGDSAVKLFARSETGKNVFTVTFVNLVRDGPLVVTYHLRRTDSSLQVGFLKVSLQDSVNPRGRVQIPIAAHKLDIVLLLK